MDSARLHVGRAPINHRQVLCSGAPCLGKPVRQIRLRPVILHRVFAHLPVRAMCCLRGEVPLDFCIGEADPGKQRRRGMTSATKLAYQTSFIAAGYLDFALRQEASGQVDMSTATI